MGQRLKWAREKSGLPSARAAAASLGLNASSYNAHENGQNKFDYNQAAQYGKKFRVDPSWLLGGEASKAPAGYAETMPIGGTPAAEPTVHDEADITPLVESAEPLTFGLWVPLISWVAAGAMAEVVDRSEFDEVRHIYAPDLDPSGEWVALRVDGTSMNKISPHDSIIFINLRQKTLVPNACYVISDEHGNATYKRWRPGGWESVSYLPQPIVEPEGEIRVIGRVRRSMIEM